MAAGGDRQPVRVAEPDHGDDVMDRTGAQDGDGPVVHDMAVVVGGRRARRVVRDECAVQRRDPGEAVGRLGTGGGPAAGRGVEADHGGAGDRETAQDGTA